MVETVNSIVNRIQPQRTVLMFGAGSSIPSRAPTSQMLIDFFANRFSLPQSGFTLPEIASLAERKAGRAAVIAALREQFRALKPTGGLLNLPLYSWKSLYTTNYDDLIEQCYERRGLSVSVYSSDFDFGAQHNPLAPKVFKLHGSIDKDAVDGQRSRIILTDHDYDLTSMYREQLYNRLKSDLAGAMLIIVGHSLADPDIREIANKTASLNAQIDNGGQIILLLYTRDNDRAALFESRGLTVCFGGIDEFFAGLLAKEFGSVATTVPDDPLDPEAVVDASEPVRHVSSRRVADGAGHAFDASIGRTATVS
jgi:hypothetical protein